MLIYLTLPESSDETYAFTDKILEIAEKYYPDENVYLAGESTNEYEFEKSFAVDNKVVSIVWCSWLCWCCSSRSTPPVCRCC